MDKWVLVVGGNREKVRDIQHGFADQDEYIHSVTSISEAIGILKRKDSYLLLVIFLDSTDEFLLLKHIRNLTNIPIIVLVRKYDSDEKIAVIEAGADEYLPWPRTSWEILASCRALIRRHTVYSRQEAKPRAVTLLEDMLIDKDLHKILICGKELQIGRHEFDLFSLLASYPERVFTYEQLFNQIWGIDQYPTENSIHSCVRRIRRELENVPECPYSIENQRGVGYYLHLTRKKKVALLYR